MFRCLGVTDIQPFWLKPFLLKPSRVKARFVVVSSFVLGVTAQDATQGMEHRARWLGADHRRASPILGEVEAAKKRVDGIEAALGALAAVGTMAQRFRC